MKSIELTEEHKEKLLEMCKKLFPQYKIWDLPLKGEYFHHIIAAKDEWNDYIPNCDLYIHWFEFCIKHLNLKLDNLYFEKIMNPIDPFDKRNYIKGKEIIYPKNWKDLWEERPYLKSYHNLFKKHLVDILYKQYKELNNE